MRYRILKKWNKYFIQKKGLFFWNDITDAVACLDGAYLEDTMYFNSTTEAVNHIKKINSSPQVVSYV